MRKPGRAPSALWRTQQAPLNAWLQDSPQGQQLLQDRTLAEACEAVPLCYANIAPAGLARW